jgi:hypothetical protein
MTAIDILSQAYTRGLGIPAASATRIGPETVICAACGCRLQTRATADDDGFGGARTWYHFAGAAGRDARGCTVACTESGHQLG